MSSLCRWRNHQPEIGRFFNIDPLAVKYVYNSPYAFSENQVTAHVELEGLEKANFSVQKLPSDRSTYTPRDKFSTQTSINNNPALNFSVDLGKKTVTNSNCSGADCKKGPSMITHEDGSMTISGIAEFDRGGGMAAFQLNITPKETSGRLTTVNVESLLVTENQSPFQMIMAGDFNGLNSESGSILLNVVPQVEEGSTESAKTGNKTSTDVELFQYISSDVTALSGVKNPNEKDFKQSDDFNKEKTKINPYPIRN